MLQQQFGPLNYQSTVGQLAAAVAAATGVPQTQQAPQPQAPTSTPDQPAAAPQTTPPRGDPGTNKPTQEASGAKAATSVIDGALNPKTKYNPNTLNGQDQQGGAKQSSPSGGSAGGGDGAGATPAPGTLGSPCNPTSPDIPTPPSRPDTITPAAPDFTVTYGP